MADEEAGSTAKPEGTSPARSPMVFIADTTAETARIGDTLRAAGYVVLEVPLATLVSRMGTQRPNLILFDIDADGVLHEITRLRKVPGSGAVDFVFLGRGDGVVKNTEDALVNDASAFFVRPVDIAALARKVEALTGGPIARPEARPSTLPPSLPPRPLSPSSMPPPPSGGVFSAALRETPPSSDRPSVPSLPAPGVRTMGPPLPMSTTSLADLVNEPNESNAPRSLASLGTVSVELQQLLAEAERRADLLSATELVPTPEEEIEAVLPADVLASLDEPLDDEDDEPAEVARTGGGHEPPHAKGTTTGGSRHPTTGAGRSPSSGGGQTYERRQTTDTPPRAPSTTTSATLPRPRTSERGMPALRETLPPQPLLRETLPPRLNDSPPPRLNDSPPPRLNDSPLPRLRSEPPRGDDSPLPVRRSEESPPPVRRSEESPPPRPSSWHPPPSLAPPASVAPLPPKAPAERARAITITSPVDARRFFAEALARRASGALCFEVDGVVRRVVLREGDLVAAASGSEQETLVHFLAARGEIARDEAQRLAAKIPPYGRHAGAALVAHGVLRQDQLWSVLRSHAEWIALAILRLSRGSAQLEPDAPGRLRGEPSVFGAATGAEIFVELVRRAVPSADALDQLGGEGARITDGANHSLLAECNLSPSDLEVLHRARGGTVGDLLARASDREILSVLHALALLGVIEPIAAPDFGRHAVASPVDPDVALLDEEAVRARVRARLELVEEGDYFAVLGVARDATGYEIRRAFLELRRAFEPARLLSPRVADLASDVKKILVVIEEAYEILRDNARRERYRRAIDARPE